MIKKIKIMHIINNLEIGGAEKILVLLLNELSKREDLDIYVVSLEGHGDLINDISDRVHVKEFNFHLFTPRFLGRFNPDFRLKLLRYVLEVKPDIIHGHLVRAEDIAKLLGAITKTPVIITSHDTLIRPGIKTKFLNRYVTKDVAVSEIVAEHLRSYYGFEDDKIEIIPNAIETKIFEKGKKKFDINRPVFIYIGRLLESKGIEDAIRGLAKLKDEYPKMEFLIYGKEVFESYKKHLDRIVQNNNWDFVKFMGRTNDVPSALQKGDIFILPSQTEGFAISVLEAAAASKPIIATKTGAIDLIVKQNKSGIFVDWNAPDQIYRAAKKILDNDLVELYGKESYKIAKNSFDIREIGQKYYELYLKTIED